MLLTIFLALGLLLYQSGLPGRYLLKQVGMAGQMGPRDDLPPPTRELTRAQNALRNLQETLPIFLTLAILSIVLGEEGWLSIAGAWVYLAGRVGHVICYLNGLSPWRSIAYSVAMIGIFMVAAPLLLHVRF